MNRRVIDIKGVCDALNDSQLRCVLTVESHFLRIALTEEGISSYFVSHSDGNGSHIDNLSKGGREEVGEEEEKKEEPQ